MRRSQQTLVRSCCYLSKNEEEAGHWTPSEISTFGERRVCVFTRGTDRMQCRWRKQTRKS